VRLCGDRRPRLQAVAWPTALMLMLSACAFSGVSPATPTRTLTSSTGSPATPVLPSTAASTPDATPGPDPTRAAGAPLPDCRYDDVPVDSDPAQDWATLVVDTIYRLPKRYAPDDLVSTSKAGLNGGYKVSRAILGDLRDMAAAAQDADAGFAVQSAYRSYQDQVTTFAGWVAQSNEQAARKVSARPGHSEHQLGTALDLRSADDATPPWSLDDFAATRAGGWLQAHAWEYGFVMSYPRGMADETCYSYEPWHYRYVGREIAAAIHESGETPRRYLWETYGPGAH
jgi:D-alanyl-D-alanine carboxypeptidase